MTNSEQTKPSNGIGFVGALQLLFIGLKLGGVITWPWWCVLLPMIAWCAWFAFCLVAVFILAVNGHLK